MRYPKSHQISRPVTVILSSGGNQTIGDRVRKILADNKPISPEDQFILTQVYLICLFRRTKENSRKTKFFKYISRREEKYISGKKEEGSEISLTPQDFINLNQWVVSQDLAGKLENLIKQAKERKRQIKREVKKLKK